MLVITVIRTPQYPISDKRLQLVEEQKGKITQEAENSLIKVNIRGENNAPVQLEIILKKAIPAPSVIVKTLNNQEIIGQLGERGIYRFDISDDIKVVMLYDNLHNKEISKLSF